MREKSVENNANIISSNYVYNIKSTDNGRNKLKERIFLHGHLDAQKGDLRNDCERADMTVVRMLIRIAVCIKMELALAEIKGDFMQSGPLNREVYVRLLKELTPRRGMLWRLLKFPHGLSDAGRQCILTIEK